MRFYKLFIIAVFILVSAFSVVHKFYVSVTQIEHVESEKSIQIISRIFIDDFENVLRRRYDESIILTENDSIKQVDNYIKTYLNEQLKISINNKPQTLNFIGKQYEDDIVICYLEIENVKNINTFEIQNTLLFEMFEDQQNVIRTKINSQQKSFILIRENNKGLLNF